MTKYRLRAVVAMMVAATLAAACSSSSKPTTSDRSSSSSGPVTVTWLSWKPSQAEGEALIAEFRKTHPNITIKFEDQQYTDYVDSLRVKVAAGQGPDIWFGQSGAFISQYADLAADLTPYLTKSMGADWRDKFYPLGIDQGTVKGRLVGVPWNLLAAGYLWYNKALFDKAGIAGPPTTLDELVADAAKLKAKGILPFVQGAKDNWINFDTFMAIANQIAPGLIYQAEDGKASWTDPKLVQAMDIWRSLFTKGVMQAGSLGISQYMDAATKFYSGKAAMIMQGTWENGNLLTQAGGAGLSKTYKLPKGTVFHPFLFPDVNGDGQPAAPTGGPDAMMMINESSKVKDAAWEFASWLLGKDGQEFWTKQLLPPSIKGYAFPEDNVVVAEQKQDLSGELASIANSQYPREFKYPDIQTALGTALQSVAAGKQSSADALKDVQSASNGITR